MANPKEIKEPKQEKIELTEEELAKVAGGASGWVKCEKCGHPYLPPMPCPQCYREEKFEQDTMS